MTENAKTITFVVVGLVAVMIGLATRPSSAELDVETLVGENLTKHFDSPDDAKRLRIVRFTEDTATLREFEVAEQDGLWTIPSKDGYPADAVRQMAEAATSLMDRKILQVANRSAGDHEQFGVIDPLSPKLEPGQKGVGTRVTMSDVHGAALADLIIGKRVRDAEGQRYVREAGRDIVYIIEIDPAKLSTNFEDWIEKDLLKLNSWDLQQVEIKDYSAEMGLVRGPDGRPSIGIAFDPRAEITLAYNDSDAAWSAVALRRFDPDQRDGGGYVEFSLAEDEELNEQTLNDLKSALDDLQIVDVVRKPAGLSRDLKAGEDFMNNREALQDLITRGFTPAAMAADGPQEIISSDGEVIATMKNGTEYVLRFGSLTNVGSGGLDGEEAIEGEVAKSKDGDVNRYLFVMARFNEGALTQPELQSLPELPTSAEESADKTAESNDEATEEAAEPEAATEETEAAEEAEEADTAEDDAEKTEEADEATESKDDKELEKLIAERKQIEQENQRKLDEYQDTLKKGRENVRDLNLRFGDWYFVVDDNVFRKIRLSRDDVIKKKEQPADDETALDDISDNEAPATAFGIPGLPDIPGVQE